MGFHPKRGVLEGRCPFTQRLKGEGSQKVIEVEWTHQNQREEEDLNQNQLRKRCLKLNNYKLILKKQMNYLNSILKN